MHSKVKAKEPESICEARRVRSGRKAIRRLERLAQSVGETVKVEPSTHERLRQREVELVQLAISQMNAREIFYSLNSFMTFTRE